MNSHVPSNPNDESWTEEKHVNFLNSMESWFVRTMLDKNDRFACDLRLDRQLPDSCESTLDSKQNVRKRNNYPTSVVYIGRNGSKMKKGSRPHKRCRRPSSHYHDSLQDQVVPQFENRREDKDEKEPPKFSTLSMAEKN